MHFLAQNCVIWRIKRKNRSNRLACRRVGEPKKSVVHFEQERCVLYLFAEQKPLGGLSPNFLVVGVHDVITPFKFGDDRFRGFGLAEGQSLHFSIDFEGRPYNTHTIVWGVILCILPAKY